MEHSPGRDYRMCLNQNDCEIQDCHLQIIKKSKKQNSEDMLDMQKAIPHLTFNVLL